MAHLQVHSMTGITDHGVGSAGSAHAIVGVNSSGTPLEYKILASTAQTQIYYTATSIQIVSLPDYEELTIYAGTTAIWTNMPQAVTEFFGSTWARNQFNLTYFTSARMVATMAVAASLNAYLFAQVSSDTLLTWGGLGSATTSPSVFIDSAAFLRTGNWVALAAGRRGDMYIRVMGSGGDSAIDPQFGHVGIQFY